MKHDFRSAELSTPTNRAVIIGARLQCRAQRDDRAAVPGKRKGAHRSLRLALRCALLWFLGCSASSEVETPAAMPVQVSDIAQPIVGGQSVDACTWPSTVAVNAWGACSGTLIHPRIVTTAAHCLSGPNTMIYFGAGQNSPGAFSLPATCKAGAQGARGADTDSDWAYCLLPVDPRVQQIPVTPPLVGCEASKYLKVGMQAWVVGYGATSAQGAGAGVKREAPVIINGIDVPNPGTLDVGDAVQGACHGDSGGPLYVHLMDGAQDWGYRVVGSTSGAGASPCDCTCSTVYVNISNHVTAIEANENIDVTPCTNAAGAFDATPACAALATAAQYGTGVFPACSGVQVAQPTNSCGVAVPFNGSSSTAGRGVLGASGSAAIPGRSGGSAAPAPLPRGVNPNTPGAAGSSGGLSTNTPQLGPSTASGTRGGVASPAQTRGTGQGTGPSGSAASGSSAQMSPTSKSTNPLKCQTSSIGAEQRKTVVLPAAFVIMVLVGLRRRRTSLSRTH